MRGGSSFNFQLEEAYQQQLETIKAKNAEAQEKSKETYQKYLRAKNNEEARAKNNEEATEIQGQLCTKAQQEKAEYSTDRQLVCKMGDISNLGTVCVDSNLVYPMGWGPIWTHATDEY